MYTGFSDVHRRRGWSIVKELKETVRTEGLTERSTLLTVVRRSVYKGRIVSEKILRLEPDLFERTWMYFP